MRSKSPNIMQVGTVNYESGLTTHIASAAGIEMSYPCWEKERPTNTEHGMTTMQPMMMRTFRRGLEALICL